MLMVVRACGSLPGPALQAPVAVAVAPAPSPAHAAAPAGVAVIGIRPALTDGHGVQTEAAHLFPDLLR